MVSNMNKKNYISINAEMLGRAYKVAKRGDGYAFGRILIWSSGDGLNIIGTDRYSLIFFHDENGYFGDDFHHKTLYFGSTKFQKNKKFMQNLLLIENQNKQVHIKDSSSKGSLVRSAFLKQKIDNVFTFELQESKKINIYKSSKFSIALSPDEFNSEEDVTLEAVENIFLKIPTKSEVPTAFDMRKIKLLDNIYLRQGKKSTKPQAATIHITDNNLLCGIRQHSFLISAPIGMDEMTIQDVFKSPEDNKDIFELALTKRKYKQIFDDINAFLPDSVFKENKKVFNFK